MDEEEEERLGKRTGTWIFASPNLGELAPFDFYAFPNQALKVKMRREKKHPPTNPPTQEETFVSSI